MPCSHSSKLETQILIEPERSESPATRTNEISRKNSVAKMLAPSHGNAAHRLKRETTLRMICLLYSSAISGPICIFKDFSSSGTKIQTNDAQSQNKQMMLDSEADRLQL
eukprot:1111065-Pelagomonas_calceolata.AAC.2